MSAISEKYIHELNNPQMLDYGIYLQCDKLLSCQKALDQLATHDELQFQLVHQVEELWMKQIIFTLIDVIDKMEQAKSIAVLSQMKRVHMIQRLMIQQLDLLETMSPKEYQEIRLQLGNGSGQESPGFITLLKMPNDIWQVFQEHYLRARKQSVESIYDTHFSHCDAYAIAESLIEFDELMQKFRWNHMFLIRRSIGIDANSLKGRPVEILQNGARQQFFPELWEVRSKMSDSWGKQNGKIRHSLRQKS
ncbi:tryptophan 2,3-dioxygenase [Glaciecola sp. MH2013]|uniref:tryptophan 2,3-dioxygenase family protein n=1 Tax=Glaciecola sp. MH2013 TaxID=2785524 RepID=UPI0018A04705|nr:tryptophan 2,3-dioxygenase family protein [Glaciecola sp. MH2013]MBF7072074.1 tryptophan 2,3-dioxygenase [Glaciecola sp. MH2013]